MKKVLLAIAAVLCLLSTSSCSVKTPYFAACYFTDYRSLLERGFFVTESDAPSFDYDAIGSMSIEMIEGHEVIKKESKGIEPYQSNGLLENKWGEYKKVSMSDAMGYFYREATNVNANGAIKFNVERILEERNANGFKMKVPVGFRISGMLIKIRE